jgi:hypothetical protein
VTRRLLKRANVRKPIYLPEKTTPKILLGLRSHSLLFF